MSGRHILGHCHWPTALLGKVVVLCALCLFASGCEAVSPPFPEGFVRLSSKLDAWENQGEGFRLIVVSNDDRAQGFLEWEAQGIYGRIVEAERKGGLWTLSLGDGGMNGVELTAVTRGSSIEVRYTPPVRAEAGGGGKPEEVRIRANRLQEAKGFQLLAARYTTKEEGRSMSLRLQYFSARRNSQLHVFDEVLRRGKSPYQRAAFVRAQQEVASIEMHRSLSGQSGRPALSLEYEEIQYPVFISDRFVSVATQYYLFDGGAHGAASTTFDVIDCRTGRRLGIGDVFAGNSWKTELSPLLKAELLRQRSFQDAQGKATPAAGSGDAAGAVVSARGSIDLRTLGLFEPDIAPSENIFLCRSGIGFEYDRYQIAPWYMGEFILVLPWRDLKPYLSSMLLSAGLFE